MIRSEDEELTLPQLAQAIGRCVATIQGWVLHGLHGVKLQSIGFGYHDRVLWGDYLRFCAEVRAKKEASREERQHQQIREAARLKALEPPKPKKRTAAQEARDQKRRQKVHEQLEREGLI